MQNVNSSNFTYVDSPLRATNTANTYVSHLPGTTTSNVVGTTNYSAVRPATMITGSQAGYYTSNGPYTSRVI